MPLNANSERVWLFMGTHADCSRRSLDNSAVFGRNALWVICFAISSAVWTTSVLAQGISVELKAVPQLGNVEIQLDVDPAVGIAGIEAVIKYELGVVHPIGVEQSDLTRSWLLVKNIDVPGEIRISMVSAEGLPAGSRGSVALIGLETGLGATEVAKHVAIFSLLLSNPEAQTIFEIRDGVVLTLKTGDFDRSGVVDLADFFLFADAFGGSERKYDLDGNGRVGLEDFFIFADGFGR